MNISDDDENKRFSRMRIDGTNMKREVTENGGGTSTTTSANTTICGEFDDDDDDILFLGDFPSDSPAEPVAGPSSKVTDSCSLKNRQEVRVPPIGKRDSDDWESFVSWYRRLEAFDTPWFQSIPITALNGSKCKSLVMSCKDLGHLTQFGKILVSFLKESIDSVKGENSPCNYSNDLVHIIETLLLRFEKELAGKARPSEVDNICEDILRIHVTGNPNLGSSRIPELLVNVYPKAFDDLMCEFVKTENPNFILPICMNSKPNFLKILKSLHTGEAFANAGVALEDDSDFKDFSNPSHKLATTLLDHLKEKSGPSYLKVLPTQLQPIFSFDSVVCKSRDKLVGSERIIEEVCCLLNELFCDCSVGSDFGDDKFLWFVLSLLPFTSGILEDKKVMRCVNFKSHPYLWMHVRKLGRFG